MTQNLDVTPKNVIENENGEVRSIVGPNAIRAYTLRTLIIGLEFEAKCKGMQMTRGPKCITRAKAITGLKTNDVAKQIERLKLMINQQLDQCLVVTDGDTND